MATEKNKIDLKDILADAKKIGDKLGIDRDDVNELVEDVKKDGLDVEDLQKVAKKIDPDDLKDAAEAVGDLFEKLRK